MNKKNRISEYHGRSHCPIQIISDDEQEAKSSEARKPKIRLINTEEPPLIKKLKVPSESKEIQTAINSQKFELARGFFERIHQIVNSDQLKPLSMSSMKNEEFKIEITKHTEMFQLMKENIQHFQKEAQMKDSLIESLQSKEKQLLQQIVEFQQKVSKTLTISSLESLFCGNFKQKQCISKTPEVKQHTKINNPEIEQLFYIEQILELASKENVLNQSELGLDHQNSDIHQQQQKQMDEEIHANINQSQPIQIPNTEITALKEKLKNFTFLICFRTNKIWLVDEGNVISLEQAINTEGQSVIDLLKEQIIQI